MNFKPITHRLGWRPVYSLKIFCSCVGFELITIKQRWLEKQRRADGYAENYSTSAQISARTVTVESFLLISSVHEMSDHLLPWQFYKSSKAQAHIKFYTVRLLIGFDWCGITILQCFHPNNIIFVFLVWDFLSLKQKLWALLSIKRSPWSKDTSVLWASLS